MRIHTAVLLPLALGLRTALAAVKTHIYIDQVPLYTSLQACAQDRLNAIVRAQASGCGDDTQLTSFACFCIDSSTEYVSIISTAVEQACERAATATTTGASSTAGAGRRAAASTTGAAVTSSAIAANVQSALAAFGSYCAKSTELTRFTQAATALTTPPPQTIYLTPPSSSSSSHTSAPSTPIAAILVPTLLIPPSLAAALFFFLRARRLRQRLAATGPLPTKEQKELDAQPRVEMFGDPQPRVELAHEAYRGPPASEMESPAVELDGGIAGFGVRRAGVEKEGWV